MRLFRGSAYYLCSRCRQRFLVLGAVRKPVEHRKGSRVAVKGGIFAYIGPATAGSQLGTVLDIGPGGLAVEYVADRPPPAGSFTLHLSPNRKSLKVRNLPVTTVSDVPTGETAPFSNIAVRRRGLKFGGFPFHKRVMLRWLAYRYGEL